MSMKHTGEVWDVHTHTTPAPETFDALARFSHYDSFVRVRAASGPACAAEIVNHRGEVQRSLQPNAFHGATRMAECDAHGVTVQVLSPTPMMLPDAIESADDAAEICRILNDANAALVDEQPTRFAALGALPMRHPDHAIRELYRIRRLGMKGVEINSNIDGLDLDDPRFFPIFEAAAVLDMAIFIHPWGGFMSPAEPKLRARMHAQRNWRPWLLAMGLETALAFDSMRSGGVHERLPHLRVMYAHGGGSFPALLGRMGHGHHARPDLFGNSARLSPHETVRDCAVYADSLTHDPWTLQLLLHLLGAERVAMGSDYPYPLGEMDPHGSKGIFPGHTIRHLPESDDAASQDAAWQHFPWLPREHCGGPRPLPVVSAEHKQQILHKTAKDWLRCR
jgi:aminocarboxymuconate-semialdehyde decarboxylase